MKKVLVSVVALTSIVICGGLMAATADRASADRSAEAQIQRANVLWQKVFQAPNEQARQDAIRATWACLAAISQLWPDDLNAVAQSGILRYELAVQSQMTRSGVDALLEVESAALRTSSAVAVERRLGEGFIALGDNAAAETHFELAERALTPETNRLEATGLLLTAGDFYASQQKADAAIRTFDRGADWPGQPIRSQLQFRLAAARHAYQLPAATRRDVARREVAAIDELVAAARATRSVTSADSAMAETAVREAARVREWAEKADVE